MRIDLFLKGVTELPLWVTPFFRVHAPNKFRVRLITLNEAHCHMQVNQSLFLMTAIDFNSSMVCIVKGLIPQICMHRFGAQNTYILLLRRKINFMRRCQSFSWWANPLICLLFVYKSIFASITGQQSVHNQQPLIMSKRILALTLFVVGCLGHGRIDDPPHRGTLWRHPEYAWANPGHIADDTELHCGGEQVR